VGQWLRRESKAISTESYICATNACQAHIIKAQKLSPPSAFGKLYIISGRLAENKTVSRCTPANRPSLKSAYVITERAAVGVAYKLWSIGADSTHRLWLNRTSSGGVIPDYRSAFNEQ